MSGVGGLIQGQYGLTLNSVYNNSAYFINLGTGGTERMRITNSGKVGIGTSSPTTTLTVQGGLCVKSATACPTEVAGMIHYDTGSSLFDLAEEYPTEVPVIAGDVLSIGNTSTHVTKSTSAYDSKLIGVVSTNPNIAFRSGMSALGGAGSPIAANTALVTLVGRVPVKVSLENGSILIGDPLTSSSVPGVAMKATRPGPIIGKALASYTQATTDNKIMVYVSLGWNGQDAPLSLTADGQVNIDSNIDPAILTSLGYQLTPTAKSSVYTVTDSLGNLVHTISTDLLSAKTLVANLTLSNYFYLKRSQGHRQPRSHHCFRQRYPHRLRYPSHLRHRHYY